MNNFFTFVSLIETKSGGINGTKGAKCKILVRSILPDDLYVATVVSNREARRALNRLKPESLVRIIMGSEKKSFRFLSDTPVIRVSNLEVINF